MSTLVATHNGPFHADDVLAWALIRVFHDADADLVRTRDPAVYDPADVVFDVGGAYEPDRQRFDHHQHDYTGPLSSAGMVLAWLEDAGTVSPGLAETLREHLVDYVDAVDNGRRVPDAAVPCFAQIVHAYNQGSETMDEFNAAFLRAGEVAKGLVEGLAAGYRERVESAAVIAQAMDDAATAGSNLIILDRYRNWKDTYFARGGGEHVTEFVLHPGVEGRWRSVAIPPERGSFAQKRSFPAAWAGLRDAELEAVTGVKGSLFCHKNRFIAVFTTRAATLAAMQKFGLIRGPVPSE
ncbi:MAG: MYG1 family protein [Myxococcota bacterium]